MLGSLAKWLRLFGFDTFYVNNEINDGELIQLAKKENRIIITRDKELTFRVKKENLKAIKILSTDLDVQLKNVLCGVPIKEEAVLSRCSLCNFILEEIKKKEVKNRVPEKIYENNDMFWFCRKCDKIYWMGSHYDKITAKINEIKR